MIIHLIILRVHELRLYFFCQYWSNNLSNVADIENILVLLYHFAAFVMPWFVAFFFEFKVNNYQKFKKYIIMLFYVLVFHLSSLKHISLLHVYYSTCQQRCQDYQLHHGKIGGCGFVHGCLWSQLHPSLIKGEEVEEGLYLWHILFVWV